MRAREFRRPEETRGRRRVRHRTREREWLEASARDKMKRDDATAKSNDDSLARTLTSGAQVPRARRYPPCRADDDACDDVETCLLNERTMGDEALRVRAKDLTGARRRHRYPSRVSRRRRIRRRLHASPSPRHVSDVPSPLRPAQAAAPRSRSARTLPWTRFAPPSPSPWAIPGVARASTRARPASSRASPRSATSPRPPRAKARASCSPSRATRDSRRRISEPAPPRAPAPRAPPARAAPPGSPGFRRRNYIRETEDALGDAARRRSSRSAVGGHRGPRADRDGSRAIRHAWNPREGPHDGSRRARDGRALDGTQRRGGRGARGGGDERGRGRGRGRGDGPAASRTGPGTATADGDGDGDGDDIGHRRGRFRPGFGSRPPSEEATSSAAVPVPRALRVLRASAIARASRARLRSRDGDVRVSSLATHAVHVAPRVVRDARRGALDDLRATATLAPASLRLTPVIVAETDDAGVLIGDGGDDADTLVEPTDPDRLLATRTVPKDSSAPRRRARRENVRQDVRRGERRRRRRPGRRGRRRIRVEGYPRRCRVRSKPYTRSNVRGDAGRKVSALRSRLDASSVATVDAAMDDEELDATAAWARARRRDAR